MFRSGHMSRAPRYSIPYSSVVNRIWDSISRNTTSASPGLGHISDKPVNEISGGEYQLVQIARAIVQRPRVILLDEPTSNLDLGNQHMVMRTVSGLVRDNGICAVMTCHDINLALRYSNGFVMMRGGTIDCAGGREVVNPDSILRVYGVEVDMGEVAGYPVVVPKEV